MKKKTSVSLDEKILKKLSAAAESQDRSVSFLISKTVEGALAEFDRGAEDWGEAVERYSRKMRAAGLEEVSGSGEIDTTDPEAPKPEETQVSAKREDVTRRSRASKAAKRRDA